MNQTPIGWLGVIRLGLVQTALGAIVVLATSVMNRVMVVELALPAVIPATLVAFHYGVQLLRPRLGYGSDRGGARSRFIIAGVALLGCGAITASIATAWMPSHLLPGLLLAMLGFGMIGVGVGAAGTCLLVLLAKRTAPQSRALAATVVWLMMIAGFVITTICAGRALEPFSSTRLIEVTSVVSVLALLVSIIALTGIEKHPTTMATSSAQTAPMPPFRTALAEVWSEAPARALAIFIFVAMLAYSAEELILDPFSGSVYGFTPGQSTQLSGALHGGVFMGMLSAALLSSIKLARRVISIERLMVWGCLASALALLGLTGAGIAAPAWPLRQNVFLLGFANGVFTVSALGAMMNLSASGGSARAGVRMGLWGAAQGVAFGLGGVLGAGASDLTRLIFTSRGSGYGAVFALEALLFLIASAVAMQMGRKVVPYRPASASALHSLSTP